MERKITKPKKDGSTSVDDEGQDSVGTSVSLKSFFLNFLLVIILSAGAYYYFVNVKPTKIEDPQILAQLKTIILLSDSITPTMAVVTNADILKAQQPAFFADVKNGDRLIIYPDLAIVYDYNANKIIKIGPVQNASIKNN